MYDVVRLSPNFCRKKFHVGWRAAGVFHLYVNPKRYTLGALRHLLRHWKVKYPLNNGAIKHP